MWQVLYDILRDIPLLRNHAPSRKRCVITRLPLELLDMIFSELSLPSQACFALTCKFLFERFGTVLKDKKFSFPHIEFGYYGTESKVPNPRERTELLLKLQSSKYGGRRWKYCGNCLKLHPAHEMNIRLEGDDTPESATCRYPGIVVLCPCIHLNARGKIRLIKALESGKLKNASNWHECQFNYSGGTTTGTTTSPTVNVTIALSLTALGDLAVQTQYVVRPGMTGNLRIWSAMCCPHENIFKYLDNVSPRQVDKECRRCQTSIEANRDYAQSSVQATRYLGEKTHPISQTWRNQCVRAYSQIHR